MKKITDYNEFMKIWEVNHKNRYWGNKKITKEHEQEIIEKAYKTFWNEEYRRCREGYTVNGYTITGDHYFFLNYYTLNNTTKNVKAMDAVEKDFPNFIVS